MGLKNLVQSLGINGLASNVKQVIHEDSTIIVFYSEKGGGVTQTKSVMGK